MKKKKVKKSKQIAEKSKPASANPSTSQNAQEEHNPFDFGGLPQRDLKKNLGCG